jgi:nitronate monooxygenase
LNTFFEELGVRLPNLQAPMAGVQGSALAIAVSNAGGLGTLPCAMLSPDAMRKELIAIRAQTDKPFNVNFFCHVAPAPRELDEVQSLIVKPYLREHPLNP